MVLRQMLLKTNGVQIRFVTPREYAAEHLPSHFVSMGPVVLLEVAPGAERLIAVVTLKRLFTRVNLLVPP